MGNIWWTQIPSARQFLEKIAQTLLAQKSVLLSAPEGLPWAGDMRDELGTNLFARGSGNSIECMDCPDDIGSFFLENYCKREKRARYRPTKTYAQFLAESDDITMHDHYFWVKNVTPKKLRDWKKFIAEYYAAIQPDEQRAGFILETTESSIQDTRSLVPFNYEKDITPYDSYIFCALTAAEAKIPEQILPYLTEVVSAFCKGDGECCEICMNDWKSLLQDPVSVYCSIAENERRFDGSSFSAADQNKLAHSLWEAQLKQLFPIIERYRSKFIGKHYEEIKNILQEQNNDTGDCQTPEDAELGLLYYSASQKKILMTQEEYEKLKFFRQMRNKLAHLVALNSEEVDKILGYVRA